MTLCGGNGAFQSVCPCVRPGRAKVAATRRVATTRRVGRFSIVASFLSFNTCTSRHTLLLPDRRLNEEAHRSRHVTDSRRPVAGGHRVAAGGRRRGCPGGTQGRRGREA